MNNLTLGGRGGSPTTRRSAADRAPAGRGRAERGARRDEQHAEHSDRGTRARVPAARDRVRAAPRLRRRGRHRGGDGVVRELEALREMTFSLIAERRRHGPAGRAGGERGATGARPARRACALPRRKSHGHAAARRPAAAHRNARWRRIRACTSEQPMAPERHRLPRAGHHGLAHGGQRRARRASR